MKSTGLRPLRAKVLAYSSAATAALLAAHETKAQIYNITSSDISGSGSFGSSDLQMNLKGVEITAQVESNGAPHSFKMFYAKVGGISAFFQGTNSSLANLPQGAVLGGFNNSNGLLAANGFRYNNPNYGGHFVALQGQPETGYVGFHAGAYKGWLKVEVQFGNRTITDVEFLPDGNGNYGAMSTGALTVGEVAAIPEPAACATGLGLLALGAAGIREHRRRKLAAA